MVLIINNNTLQPSFSMDDSLHIWFLDHLFLYVGWYILFKTVNWLIS